jgi:SAM-dependent methyltransferase
LTNHEKERPIALDTYNKFAERFAAMIETAPYNANIERPATLSLLPDVKGKHVLDAGCGSGLYAEILVDRGAKVIAIDVSPNMLEFAKQRLGHRARIRQANLEEPLDFLANSTIHVVLSSLVLDYIKDWEPLFAEFSRILRPGGYFIFSTEHPIAAFKYREHPEQEILAENYFEREYMEVYWSGAGITVPSYRRPLSTFFECLEKTGFTFEKLIEPRPTAGFKEKLPQSYDKVSRNPTFLCIRARKSL